MPLVAAPQPLSCVARFTGWVEEAAKIGPTDPAFTLGMAMWRLMSADQPYEVVDADVLETGAAQAKYQQRYEEEEEDIFALPGAADNTPAPRRGTAERPFTMQRPPPMCYSPGVRKCVVCV